MLATVEHCTGMLVYWYTGLLVYWYRGYFWLGIAGRPYWYTSVLVENGTTVYLYTG